MPDENDRVTQDRSPETDQEQVKVDPIVLRKPEVFSHAPAPEPQQSAAEAPDKAKYKLTVETLNFFYGNHQAEELT